jgi:hypothetical protein
MEEIPDLPGVEAPETDFDGLIYIRNGRQVEVPPPTAVEQMPGEIPDMKPLHDEDDGALLSRMVGTAVSPSSLAASTRPCPAMISPASSIRTGFVKPNRLMLLAICRICFFE